MKKMFLVLAVLLTVVGVAFAYSYKCKECGKQTATTKGGTCADCVAKREKEKKDAASFNSAQGKYCTSPDTTTKSLWDDLNCDEYNQSQTSSGQ